MTFVLILMMMGPGTPNRAITNVPGFKSLQDCETAGKAVQAAPKYSSFEYVCIKQ